MKRWFPWAWATVVGVLYALVSLLSWRRLTINSWDNAIFEQAIKAYSKFQAPIVNVKGPGYNILGDHFSPIDALLGPIYRVFPSGKTLLVAQAVLIAISVVVVSRLAISQLGGRLGIVISVLYGIAFGFGSAVIVDFHEVAFAVPLLALAGAAFVERRYDWVVWWSLPLLLVKEDMGVTVAAIGVALWLVGERRRGLILAVIGAVALVLIVWVFIPAMNVSGSYDYTSDLGGDSGLWHALTTELDRKALTLALTLGITGFAALWSPWAVVLAPTLAWRFLGSVDYYWGTEWHYSLVLMPIVFVAMIDALGKREWLRFPAVVLGATVSGFMLAGAPLAALVDPVTWEPSPRTIGAEGALNVVPNGATVESDLGLLKYFVADHNVYWVGTIGDVVPDYIVLDRAVTQDDIVEFGRTHHGAEFEVVYDVDSYTVARRVG